MAYDTVVILESDESELSYFSESDQASRTQPVAVLREGEWAALPLRLDGRRIGLYVKLIDLTEDLQKVRVYATALRGPQVEPAWLEKEVSEYVSIPVGPDRNALIGGFVDEQTFAEEVILGLNWSAEMYSYIIARTKPDVAFVYFTETDEWMHRMYGYLDETSPWYDEAKVAERRALFATVFEAADRASWRVWQAMGGPEESTAVLVSDHGFASTWKIANVNERLAQLGLYNPTDPASSKAMAYSAGATTQIYINLAGRQPGGVVKPEEFEAVKQAIVEGLRTWRDEDGTPILNQVVTKEEAERITVEGRTFDFSHPTATGDVVAFANHPYQFDAASPGYLVTPGIPYFTGQHGYLADTVSEPHGNLRPIFAAGGKGVPAGVKVPGTASIVDVAPTLAKLLGLPAPAQSDGAVLPGW